MIACCYICRKSFATLHKLSQHARRVHGRYSVVKRPVVVSPEPPPYTETYDLDTTHGGGDIGLLCAVISIARRDAASGYNEARQWLHEYCIAPLEGKALRR